MPLPTSASAFAARFVPLWIGDRGGTDDFIHFGALAVCDARGRLSAWAGNPEALAFLRSSAKPFQAVALLRRGLQDALSLSDAEVACACASHSGEDRHVAASRRILAAAGVAEDALLCGTHPPFAGERSLAPPDPPTPIRNNCSGKHAAMLAVCKHEGWPASTYPEADHPLQVENLATFAAYAGLPPEDVVVATDNCTVPTFATPLRASAMAFARLLDPQGLPADVAAAGAAATTAMRARPDMVGGASRLDTALMELTSGRLVVKTGANGFYAAAQVATAGRGARGFALKLASAEGEAAKAPVVVACLRACGLLSDDEAHALAVQFTPPQKSCRGAVVGSARFVGGIRHG